MVSKYSYIFRLWLAGSDKKLAVCKDLGADVCINYKTEDFVKRVKEETGRKGISFNIKTSLFLNVYRD